MFKYSHISIKNLLESIVCTVLLAFSSCSQETTYEQVLEKELSRNVRYDSLFFGLKLGMTRSEFYNRCWELNAQGIFYQGSRNTTVLYKLMDLGSEIDMDFYPNFQNDSIVEMPVYMKYAGWAPWNKEMFGDSLQLDLIPLFEDWYGEGFFPITLADNSKGYVKIDGNRRILLTVQDDISVKALFSDMTKIKDDPEGRKK